ncbi:MAG: hypothetical protein JNJ54_09535 [Myxococcaceae bacterium]|nr:hypothetical protein [Myxococcaceae bacterium]
MPWRIALAVVALSACGRSEPVEPPLALEPLRAVDAGSRDAGRPDAGLDGGAHAGRADGGVPTSCASQPGPVSMQRCRLRLRFTRLTRSTASCFVDVRMSPGEEGVLEWDCGQPSGRAEVQFARARFTGWVTDRVVDVCYGSEFDWSDGCRWTSAQALRGAASAGATLTLTYGEAPLSGQTGCQVPCQASGDVVVLGP